MASYSTLVFLLTMLGGGAGDALDFLPADAYWKTKAVTVSVDSMTAELKSARLDQLAKLIEQLGAADGAARDAASRQIAALGPAALPQVQEASKSNDPEIASRAKALVTQIGTTGKSAAVRRLMAIRTLGELKKPEAAAALRPVLDSKVMFEADYAREALNKIEGKPTSRPRPAARDLQEDLWLLPESCAIVAQASAGGIGGNRPSIEKLLEQLPMITPAERAESLQEFYDGIISLTERIGNIRIEAVTLGLAVGKEPRPEAGVVIVRGLYDSAAADEALKQMLTADKDRAVAKIVNGLEVVQPEHDMGLVFFSNQRLVLVAGDSEDKLPLEAMTAALKAGKGKLGQNAEMARLIGSIDTTQPLWAAAKLADWMKAGPLAPFDTLTFVARAKDGGMSFELQAAGNDVQPVKSAVEQANGYVKQGLEEIQQHVAEMPVLQAYVDFLQSVKISADGTKATGTAGLKQDAANNMLMGVPMLFFASFGQMHDVQPGAVDVDVVPVDPAPRD